MNYANGYNPNTWMSSMQNYNGYQPYTTTQTQIPSFTTTFVSDIAEAIATKPDVTGKPLFFYNKSNEEIYVKQYDNTGAAPVRTYKLVVENTEPQVNPVLDSIKVLDNKINDIKKLLTPEIVEENDKKGRR